MFNVGGSDTFNTENKNSIIGQDMYSARSLEEENALDMNNPLLKQTPGPGAYFNKDVMTSFRVEPK
jgi:hypothetical protein